MKNKLTQSALYMGALLFPVFATFASDELQVFKGCRLSPMRGADGDSFEVIFPDNIKRVIRLYAVDCIEAAIWDETDSLRLKEQRRYFGISNCRSTPVLSINEAKRFGELAKKESETLLAKPFTVHTVFADGRGSGYQKRIYAFVTTSSGEDLGTHLVSQGLARAFGVCRQNPDGLERDHLRAHLESLELKAAKLGRGAWALTDWNSFVAERNMQRAEEAELSLAIDRAVHSEMIDPNTAPRDQLMTLPGIGETLALRIIENRPYEKADDLLKIKGFGKTSLKKCQTRLPEKFRLP